MRDGGLDGGCVPQPQSTCRALTVPCTSGSYLLRRYEGERFVKVEYENRPLRLMRMRGRLLMPCERDSLADWYGKGIDADRLIRYQSMQQAANIVNPKKGLTAVGCDAQRCCKAGWYLRKNGSACRFDDQNKGRVCGGINNVVPFAEIFGIVDPLAAAEFACHIPFKKGLVCQFINIQAMNEVFQTFFRGISICKARG